MREKLNIYSKNNTSQYGEDGIIDFLIKTSKVEINKSCFEVGAGDGKTLSNTYSLWHEQSWDVILVEGSPERYKPLIKEFSANKNVKIVSNLLEINGENSIDELVTLHFDNNIRDIGVLSIDIDSFDYHVFKNIKKIRPQIIVIEFNNSIPPHIDYFDPEGEIFLRCSAKSLERLGNEKGYKLVACTTTNAFLLREDCFDENQHPDAPVGYLFDYEGQFKNNSTPFSLVHSQLISKYPVFLREENRMVKLIFQVRGLITSFFLNTEPYKKPSHKVIKKLNKSGLFI